jgi:hypothetical protein
MSAPGLAAALEPTYDLDRTNVVDSTTANRLDRTNVVGRIKPRQARRIRRCG